MERSIWQWNILESLTELAQSSLSKQKFYDIIKCNADIVKKGMEFMKDFIFSLNATVPIFLVILLGWGLRRTGLFTEEFAKVADRYVFKVALPLLLFEDIAAADIYKDFDVKFVVFCAVVTTIMFLGVWGLASALMRDKSMVGAFSQAAVRGSGAILGIAFVKNMYGSSGMAPMMIISAIPLYNIYSVLILTFSAGGEKRRDGNRKLILSALKNVVTNPIILGIAAGIPFSLLRINIPQIPMKAIDSVAATATPIALLMVGTEFEGRKALAKLKPTMAAVFIKLVLLPALILPAAVFLGFRDSAMVSILIVAGAPTTVTCYIMAKNMGNDEILTSSIVVMATLLSSITLTIWIFLLKLAGVI